MDVDLINKLTLELQMEMGKEHSDYTDSLWYAGVGSGGSRDDGQRVYDRQSQLLLR